MHHCQKPYTTLLPRKNVLMQRQLLTVGLSCRNVLVLGRCTLFKKEPFPISRFSEKLNIFNSENEGIRATHPPSRQQDYALTEVLHCPGRWAPPRHLGPVTPRLLLIHLKQFPALFCQHANALIWKPNWGSIVSVWETEGECPPYINNHPLISAGSSGSDWWGMCDLATRTISQKWVSHVTQISLHMLLILIVLYMKAPIFDRLLPSEGWIHIAAHASSWNKYIFLHR